MARRAPDRSRSTVRWALALVALVAAGPAPLAAQGTADTTRVLPGARVRVRLTLPPDAPLTANDRWKGEMVRLDADSILVRFDDRVAAFPRSRLVSLDVRVGERSRGRAIARGAAIGGVIGAAIGIAIGSTDEGCEQGEFCIFDRDDVIALSGMMFGAGGMALGAASGAVHGREQWRPVQLTPETRVGLAAVAGGVALRVAF